MCAACVCVGKKGCGTQTLSQNTILTAYISMLVRLCNEKRHFFHAFQTDGAGRRKQKKGGRIVLEGKKRKNRIRREWREKEERNGKKTF